MFKVRPCFSGNFGGLRMGTILASEVAAKLPVALLKAINEIYKTSNGHESLKSIIKAVEPIFLLTYVMFKKGTW